MVPLESLSGMRVNEALNDKVAKRNLRMQEMSATLVPPAFLNVLESIIKLQMQ